MSETSAKPAKPLTPAAPAAAIRTGYHVAYIVNVNGKEILSRGEVFGFRRVGHNKAEITLMHAKTGAIFSNVLPASSPVLLTGLSFDPESGDAVAALMGEHLKSVIKAQVSDFFTLMPIED